MKTQIFALILLSAVVLVSCDQSLAGLDSKSESTTTLNALTTRTSTPTTATAAAPAGTVTVLVDPSSSPQPTNDEISSYGALEPGCGLKLPIVQKIDTVPITTLPVQTIPEGLIPEAAQPALEHLLEHPETVGLVAFELGNEAEGIYLNPDVPMPLASVVKIINLVAYAQAAGAGQLDPAEWIPLADLELTYLPGLDLGAHNRAITDLADRSLIGRDPPSTPLEEVPWMMIRHSSNAASDYLHLRLGQEALEETIIGLGLSSHTAPCPWLGQFLIMANHTRPGNDLNAIRDYIRDPESYGRDVMQLTRAFVEDMSFRKAEMNQPRGKPSLAAQLLFSANLNAQASAADYARLMAMIMTNQIGSGYTNILIRRALEWPMIFPDNQALFSTVGYKNGSLPGILTIAYYAQRRGDGKQLVVILFFRDLPNGTYRRWRRELPHDELARWLLADPGAIEVMRSLLGR